MSRPAACSQHTEEDRLENGHALGDDDSLLESGNAETKKAKAIVFWGGTARRDAFFKQVRFVDDPDKPGELMEQHREMPANACYEEQLLRNRTMKQEFETRRHKEESRAVQARKELKREQADANREKKLAVMTSLGKRACES